MMQAIGDIGTWQLLLSVCVGIGVSAACGFRIFVPPLILGMAHRLGLPLVESMPGWISSLPVLVALAMAAVVEIGAYYLPWFDNMLDTVASPAAVIAGVLLTAGILDGVDPSWRWALAIIAGGGAAGVTQAATVMTRGLSSVTTGGVGNPVVSTGESVGAVSMSLLAIFIAPVAALVFLLLVVWMWRIYRRTSFRTNRNA